MPKIKSKTVKPNPLSTIEAPSTDRLNGDRIREELFHLERTLSNNAGSYSDMCQALDDVHTVITEQNDLITDLKDNVLSDLKTVLEKILEALNAKDRTEDNSERR